MPSFRARLSGIYNAFVPSSPAAAPVDYESEESEHGEEAAEVDDMMKGPPSPPKRKRESSEHDDGDDGTAPPSSSPPRETMSSPIKAGKDKKRKTDGSLKGKLVGGLPTAKAWGESKNYRVSTSSLPGSPNLRVSQRQRS